MTEAIPASGKQIRSNIKSSGHLEITLVDVPTPEPGTDDVLIRVEAAPINPSDLGLLFGPADMTTASAGGTADNPTVTAEVPPKLLKSATARFDQDLPVGNEGAGIVVKAGDSPAAQSLLGKTVAVVGGAMYSQYRVMPAGQCLVLPSGTTPAEGASCFVNPLTALGMVETMRTESHTALVHTAAASNLGQMLVKICLKDGIDLVNIVRRQEHVDLLKSLGAKYVCNSSDESFMEDLTAALAQTNATIAFDATGGGTLSSQILTAMESAQSQKAGAFSRYGSTVHKQVYIYGGLDRSPTTLNRAYGMAWGLGGWLLTPFLQKIGPKAAQALRERVAEGIKTTFASSYSHEVSLAGALDLSAIAGYGKQATGEKYLIKPQA
ncbi:MAG: zinc-binding dehydrogenase [Pseudomonadales bacterium]